PNGSPGEVNRVVFRSAVTTVKVDLSPAVFSPNGDGIEDSTVIKLTAPDQKKIELKIYDRQGRVVYEFDIGTYHDNYYVWYGLSDSGNRLPIGIYIVYCDVEGVGSVKKPVVIAR
ncbi:MAG: gliding motility-associated C-terminal domain-containing protein, partial [candidate division Zixibacteria bacterium]|nr:gliding motility-associated C-terminal domain-containing protein [candidate division Zixibacteria bacterium]